MDSRFDDLLIVVITEKNLGICINLFFLKNSFHEKILDFLRRE